MLGRGRAGFYLAAAGSDGRHAARYVCRLSGKSPSTREDHLKARASAAVSGACACAIPALLVAPNFLVLVGQCIAVSLTLTGRSIDSWAPCFGRAMLGMPKA